MSPSAARAGGDGRLHVVSLVGPGGVHANDRHLVALAALAARQGVPEVRVHALLDGRDTPPRSARAVRGGPRGADSRAAHPDARIATVGGRYCAMDRDQRWDRTKRGYDAIVHGVGEHAPSALAAIDAAYARGENDEFVRPTVIDGVDGRVRDGDPIVHANFRADRARQLTHALADGATSPPSTGPRPARVPRDLLVVTMTEYEAGLPVEVAFPPEEAYSLAHAASDAGWRQFHVAETEKYAHVTYFFNGGREAPLPGEDRLLVPSPKVATYDLQPEMSAAGVTDALVDAIDVGRLRPDRRELREPRHGRPHRRLGRDGRGAPRRSTRCLGRVVAALEAADARHADTAGSLLVVTADHGNADEMRDARRPAGDRPFAQPGADRRRRAGGRRARTSTTASSPTSRRRSASWPACRAGPAMTGALAARSASRPAPRTRATIRAVPDGGPHRVNPFLAIGQIIVSIALIAAILLQSRGTGLSGTFGGDSAVYRSRRGVERRLWQFTIVLFVLFVLFSLASFIFPPSV